MRGTSIRKIKVASFTDAWIETNCNHIPNINYTSHLLQMRGLKRTVAKCVSEYLASHLLQMRGLKPILYRFYATTNRSHLLQMRGLKQFE